MRSAMSVTTRLPPLLPGAGAALGAAAGSLRPVGRRRPGGAGGGVSGAGPGGRDGHAVTVGVDAVDAVDAIVDVVAVAVADAGRSGSVVDPRSPDRGGADGLGHRGRRRGAARVGGAAAA